MAPTLPVVLDTHALYWWAVAPDKLSDLGRSLCTEAEAHRSGLVASAISLWELGLKAKQGKLDLGMRMEDFARKIEQLGTVEVVPVDTHLWLRNLALDWDHKDPADRTIVALAGARGLALLTRDETISSFYELACW